MDMHQLSRLINSLDRLTSGYYTSQERISQLERELLRTQNELVNRTSTGKIRINPPEIFKGKFWDDIHITTTLYVQSGDILLIRAAGVISCPGLEEQIASLYPTRANGVSNSSGVG